MNLRLRAARSSSSCSGMISTGAGMGGGRRRVERRQSPSEGFRLMGCGSEGVGWGIGGMKEEEEEE